MFVLKGNFSKRIKPEFNKLISYANFNASMWRSTMSRSN